MPDAALRAGVMGFYGKLPACGDFVRAGLPRSFTDPWDAWLTQVLPASRARLGARWLAAWQEAPVWRFTLPPGACGSVAAIGVFMPSVDRAGRHFPLVLAWLGPPGDTAFLDAAEAAGRAAIAGDLRPVALSARLAAELATAVPAAPVPPPAGAVWWTEGGPHRSAGTLNLPGLPDAAAFADMLEDA